MRKVLVTGGAGFLGSHLVHKLIQKNYKVMIVDNLTSRGGIPFVNPKSIFLRGDLIDSQILKKIENFKPEIIYHLAAQSAGEPAYDDPKQDLLNNGYCTYLICNLAKKINAKKLIYTSSVAVYGNNKKAINEKTPINPDSIYGISKYLGELYIKQILYGTKTNTIIYRIFNTYGPGENLNYVKKGMVSIYCSYLWKRKNIIVKGSLKRFRDFTYINDCVSVLYKGIFHTKKNKIYNLSSGEKTTVKNLLILIQKLFKPLKKKVLLKKNTLGDSFGFHSLSDLVKKDFNYKFMYPLEKGLKDYINWVKSVPVKKDISKYHPLQKYYY